MHSQKALQNGQYPRTIVERHNVLSTHQYDKAKKSNNDNRNQEKFKKKDEQKSEEKIDELPPLSFAQLEGKCYCCSKTGHKPPDCYNKSKIPQEEWAINKTQLAIINNDENNSVAASITEEEVKQEKHIGWAGMHITFTQKRTKKEIQFETDLKKLVLLDSDWNATIFCEEEYVASIWDVNESMGVGTNGNGQLISTQKCIVPYLGEKWFNKDSMTNIIAMKDMTDKFRVTMDSAVEKALFVHMPKK